MDAKTSHAFFEAGVPWQLHLAQVGSQGDGSAQLVCKSPADQAQSDWKEGLCWRAQAAPLGLLSNHFEVKKAKGFDPTSKISRVSR